ncbi:MAG: hypothetical protein U0361_13790 [Nitrospiraceae bacterium]
MKAESGSRETREKNDEVTVVRPEQGTMQSQARAQAMAALLELLTDPTVIVCNRFPLARGAEKSPTVHPLLYDRLDGECINPSDSVSLAKPKKQVVVFDGIDSEKRVDEWERWRPWPH